MGDYLRKQVKKHHCYTGDDDHALTQEQAYRGLAAAVFHKALKDYVSTNPVLRLDAGTWLALDAPIYCSVLGIDAGHVTQCLIDETLPATKVREKRKQYKKEKS